MRQARESQMAKWYHKLIVCGSATSWMLNKLINSKGAKSTTTAYRLSRGGERKE